MICGLCKGNINNRVIMYERKEKGLNVTEELMAQCSFGRIWAAYEFSRVRLKPEY